MNDILFGTTKSPRESLEKAIELTQKAIALDDDIPAGHAFLSYYYCFRKEYDKVIAEGDRAVALGPSTWLAHSLYALALVFAGRPEEAIPLFQKAIRLNPFGPSSLYSKYSNFGIAFRSTGRFEEAVSVYKKAIQLSPDNISAHIGLAGTYIMVGREKEARAEAAEVLRINPKFSVDYHAKVLPFKDQSETDKVINALRKAGLR